MKQKNNKNITKITSGALALLLASGCLIGNSKADSEAVQGEGDQVQIGDKAEGKPDNFDNIGNSNDGKQDKPTEKTNDAEKPDTNKEDKTELDKQKNILKSSLEELPKFYAEDAGYKNEFKNKLKDTHAKYTDLLNGAPTIDQLKAAINDIHNLTTVEANNNLEANKQDEEVRDQEPDNKGNKTNPDGNTTTPDKGGNSDNNKETDNNNNGENSGSKPAETNNSNNNPSTDNNSGSDKANEPSVPGENDSDVSKEIKGKIAGEINKFKALLNNGSWTDESIKAAKAKISDLELVLMKSNLTEKDLTEVKVALNDIQINLLKKKEVVTVKRASNNVIKSNSGNVKTGVESLASVLITLSSSTLALFASKKRK